jgi:hypothetical protein
MSRLARAVAVALLITTVLGISGCIHTWAQTHAEFPPSVYNTPHTHGQPNPPEG